MSIWFDEIDASIRHGNLVSARRQLKQVNRNQIERKDLAQVCALATRAGLSELAIRWLNPIVRAERKLLKPATERERAEYAIALIRIGAQPEALSLLKPLSPKEFPQILLFRAVGLFSQWDYASALPLLDEYLGFPLSEYQRIVGNVNLAAALIFEAQYDRADRVLKEALRESRKAQATLLLGNCFELSAQLALGRGALDEAERNLKEASGELERSGGLDSFFVHKWGALVALKKAPTRSTILKLDAVRKEATERRHWESVRDCDFYLAMHTRERNRIAHLYHGTPFPRFRQRIREELGSKVEVPAQYDWLVSGERSDHIVDLALGEAPGTRSALKPGQIPHRLLQALAHDFYRPYTIAGLFGHIFPDDFFHPVYSVGRIHQALTRLREWFAEADLSLEVDESEGHYRLIAARPACVRTTLVESGSTDSVQPWLQKLRARFADGAFSSHEAARCLDMPLRSTIRRLTSAASGGKISRLGSGRAQKYRFPAN